MSRRPTLKHFLAFLEKKGFSNIEPRPEDCSAVMHESNRILEKNGLPKITEIGEPGHTYMPWDTDMFYQTKSSVQACVDAIADKQVYVFDNFGTNLPDLVRATISPQALSDLILEKKHCHDLYIYLPGWAFLIYSWESQYYDKVSPVGAKVFFGRVKTSLA